MGGFIKGIAVGLASFVLGFLMLAVAVPVDSGAPPGTAPVQTDLAPGAPGALTNGTPATGPDPAPVATEVTTNAGAMPAAAAPGPAESLSGQATPQTAAPPAPAPGADAATAAAETRDAPALGALPGAPALPGETGAEATVALASLPRQANAASAVPPPPPSPDDTPAEHAAAVEALPSARAGALPPIPGLPASGGAEAAVPLAAPATLATAATPVERPAPDAPSDRAAPLAALPAVATPQAPTEPALPSTSADAAEALAAPATLATTATPVERPAPDAPSDRAAPLAALPAVATPQAPTEPALPSTSADAAEALAAPATLATTATPVERPAPDAPSDRAAPLAALPEVVVAQPPAEVASLSTAGDAVADVVPLDADPGPAPQETTDAPLAPVLADPAMPATAADTAAAPPQIGPVAAATTPTGEPLLATTDPERPPVTILPTVVPGVVVSRGGLGDGSMVLRGGGATAGRLPTIGEAPSAAAEPAPAEDTRPAVVRFAATPEIAAGEMPMGVVLTDDPGAETAILALPVPVTIAMDPYDPDAPRRAEAYRRAGHEIALSALNLPGLATDSDLATIIEAWRRTFPEAVAVIDVPLNGLGANPRLARNFAAALAPEGYGAISLRDGLDAFLRAARGQGMRAASVYRMIEPSEQSDVALRRLIDRAAFEALRQPGVLIAGSAADFDTMRELGDFARGSGRAGVALVPASAILNRN